MPLHRLGLTGPLVSRVGLGLAALGRPAYINLGRERDLGSARTIAAMERRCHDLLDAAYASGVRYVDAARSYGMAEPFLASWLKKRAPPADAVIVGSKWGYAYVGDWRLDATVHEVKDLSLSTLLRQFAESRALLGERLLLYQIHSATLESGVLDNPAVLDELVRLRSAGVVIGLTVSGPRQADVIRRAFDAQAHGINPFQVVQATWNLLEPSAGPALAEARARGWGVIVKEALANGRLTSAEENGPDHFLQDRAAALGTTLDAIALAAALAQPWADVVLSGAVTTDQLVSNLSSLDIDPGRLAAWPSIAESPTEYWGRRGELSWG